MDEKLRESSEVPTIDVMRIMEMIPHRYPFLLVDRVVELEVDKRAVGIKNVTINESFFQGHFPRQPVMPGVLIVEAMAQTAAVLVVQTLQRDAAGKLVYFMTIDEARFRKPVSPGDTLRIHVEKRRSRRNVWKFDSEVRVEGTLVASARFAAMIVDD
jgi:3-hydroxyacyl-[acyl-carrier-protein] dehydratase